MIKTVIFDMDGVIVDTEPVHRYAYYLQFSELNIEVPEEMYTTFTGFSTRNTFQTLKSYFPTVEQEVEDLIQRKRTIFNDAFDTKEDLELLGKAENVWKVSVRDIPYVMSNRLHGATTVAATMRLAAMAGIRVPGQCARAAQHRHSADGQIPG